MLALRSNRQEQGTNGSPEQEGHRHGAVRCPRCTATINVVGWSAKLAEEFSIRCEACHARSFHTRTAMASGGGASKSYG